MQKSENKIKPIYWGWDGIYEYCQLRQYYRQITAKDIKDECAGRPAEESTGLNPVQGGFESHAAHTKRGSSK